MLYALHATFMLHTEALLLWHIVLVRWDIAPGTYTQKRLRVFSKSPAAKTMKRIVQLTLELPYIVIDSARLLPYNVGAIRLLLLVVQHCHKAL